MTAGPSERSGASEGAALQKAIEAWVEEHDR